MSAVAKWGRRGLLLAPFLFYLVFFIYPLVSILDVSFRLPDGTFRWDGFTSVFQSPYFREILAFTVAQASFSTFVTILLALPGAYVFVRYRFVGKSLLRSLIVLPFVLPTVVVSAAFSALIGRTGLLNTLLAGALHLESPPLNLERTLSIIILAHVFYNYPLALRMISSYWANQSPRVEESARVLGCHGWRLWWYIRIPLLRPILLAAAVLVFLFTFTSFGVILILGGGRFATLEVEIYRQAVNMFDLPVAGALSVLQMGSMLLLMIGYTRLQSHIGGASEGVPRVATNPAGFRQHAWIAFNLIIIGGLLFVPLFALIARSLGVPQDGLTLSYYGMLSENTRASILFVSPLTAVWNSLRLALGTTVIAVALGLLAAKLLSRRQWIARLLDPFFMLPLATSAVTLGFGYIIALDEPPLNLRTSPVLILCAHVLVAFPFVIRNVVPAIRAVPVELREAARMLGASPLTAWRTIELPLIARSMAVGAIFAFTVSMGEFGATIFVARPEFPTLPVAIYRLLGQPGIANYGQALALSVILMAVCALAFLLLDRLGATERGEF